MLKELIVSSSPHETKVAILEDDQLAEVYFERPQEHTIAGSIYKGRVKRVLPGMQSAFVDIGLERDAFLYVSDFLEDVEEYDKIVSGVEEKVAKMEESSRPRPVHAPPPPAPAPPAPETAVTQEGAIPVAPGAGAPAGNGSAPPAAAQEQGERDRGDRGGDRDRGRRRRGRRRGRFRDRGFPDAKYADRREMTSPPPAHADAPVETPPPAAAAAEKEEPMILPGESLAKYRHNPPAEAEPHATETTTTEPEEAGVSAEEPTPSAFNEHRMDAVQEAAENIEASTPAPVQATPIESEPEAVESAAPLAEDRAEPGEPEAPAYTAPDAPPVTPEPSPDSIAVANEEHVSSESDSAVNMPEPPSETAAPPTEAAGEAPPLEQASVRGPSDQPRFQRMSRRMRRKMREQDRPHARPDGVGARTPERTERVGRPQALERVERTERPEHQERGERVERSHGQPLISDLLREGQEIIVQIAKEPLGKKGARITSHVALPGRFVVYMPTVEHVGVSRKISSEEERFRLKRLIQEMKREIPGGFIVRTAADGCSDEDLKNDIQFLHRLWVDIRAKAEKKGAPVLLHRDLGLVERILRDQLSGQFNAVWVDNEQEYEKILEFVQQFQPTLVSRVKLYTKDTPIFEEFNIQTEIDKSLKPKVWLKSGGYIVINQTEALVAIDVNTGKYVGKTQRLEDTIVKTNVDAIREIVRQIRLRDLGGIIVVDFIDMDERKNRSRVMQALEESLRNDRAPSKVLAFNDFGLVAITRKRVKQSLERTLCAPCPACSGSGFLKSPHTVAMEILAEAHKLAPQQRNKDVTLRVNPEVARYLKQRDVTVIQEIEDLMKRAVIIKSDPMLHSESFDFN